MTIEEIYSLLSGKLTCKVYIDKLSKHTSIKVGGKAIIVEPASIEQISFVIKLLVENGIEYYVLGNGTNILASDRDCKYVMIKIANNLSNIIVDGDLLICEAGASLHKVIGRAKVLMLGGMEALFGIPGTLGGAVTMNAGCYNREIKDYVKWVEYIDEGIVQRRQSAELGFGYRKSIFIGKKYIITRVCLKLQPKEPSDIIQECREYMARRRHSQPLDQPSAGSVFRRAGDIPTPILIEKACLKGLSIGQAECSTKHCGFIVNKGQAAFCDIVELIGLIQKTVEELFDILLDIEIIILGEDDEITCRLPHSYHQ